MEISFLGGCNEVGGSAFLLESNGLPLLLDCGTKTGAHYKHPDFSQAKRPQAVVISHAHLDHFGYLPAMYRHGPMPAFATFPSVPVMELLLEDTVKILEERREPQYFSPAEQNRMRNSLLAMPYEKRYEFYNGDAFSLHDAGHIVGSAQVLFESGERKLAYTGDINLSKTRMHDGAKQLQEADALIIESTYGGRDHPDRKKLEEQLCSDVEEALQEKKLAIVPCFAVSRTQEIMLVLKSRGFDFVLDGMGAKVTRMMLDFPSYYKDSARLAEAFDESRLVEGPEQRRKAAKEGAIIICTAGMLEGGPAVSYMRAAARKNVEAEVFLTGFQAERTNGRRLLETGMMNFAGTTFSFEGKVHYYEFSAHSGKKELVDYARKLAPEKIFCVHGDTGNIDALQSALKEEGFDASIPKKGDKAEVW